MAGQEDAAPAEHCCDSVVPFPLTALLPGPHHAPVLAQSLPPWKSTSSSAELTKTINSPQSINSPREVAVPVAKLTLKEL